MARWWAGLANTTTSGGASLAAVVDVGNWDATQLVNLPGQSGDPRSPHYADAYGPWVRGEYAPLPYSQAAIDAVVAERLVLMP